MNQSRPVAPDYADRIVARIRIGRVQNRARYAGPTLYVGRANPAYDLRNSALRNPNRIGSPGFPDAGSTLPAYRRHLATKIRLNDPDVMRELRALWTMAVGHPDGVTLLCWCGEEREGEPPVLCHSQEIRATLRVLAVSGPEGMEAFLLTPPAVTIPQASLFDAAAEAGGTPAGPEVADGGGRPAEAAADRMETPRPLR